MADADQPRSFHASPTEAEFPAPAESVLYLACLHEGTGVDEPDSIAVVDADPDSDTYGEIVHDANARRRGRASTTSAGTAAARPATDRTALT